jgi:hypothetical protein
MFSSCMRQNPSPLTSSQLPAQACSSLTSADSTTTMDRLDGSRASAFCILMGSHSTMLGLLSEPHLSCYSPQVPCASGALDVASDDEVPIPCLYVPSPLQLSDHAAAASIPETAADVPIWRFPPCSALVSCSSNDKALIQCPTLSCVP